MSSKHLLDLPRVSHTVFFWLKNPGSREDRDALIAGLETLAEIDTVKAMRIGMPAATEKRDVVDDGFDVSELLFFDDVAGQNAYQVDPIHKQFVQRCEHLWRKVVVFDSAAV